MKAELQSLADRDRLALVGVAKNCGKTTTLNGLLRWRQKPPPALISIGVDGEQEDVLLGTAKPAIGVQAGQWIITARKAAEQASASLQYVRSVGIDTPLGEVLACQVREPGNVILAGVKHRREILRALEVLGEEGVEAVWIDGAYGRISGAHPEVCEAVVISTGAIVGATLEEMIGKTEALLTRLEVPAIEERQHREVMERALSEERVYFFDRIMGAVPLPLKSAMLGLSRARDQWRGEVEAVAIPGLVSDRVAEELLGLDPRGRVLLIADGTVLHLSGRIWRRLRKHWRVEALRPIEVAGISYNPTALSGDRFEAEAIESGLRKSYPEGVLFNPLSESSPSH